MRRLGTVITIITMSIINEIVLPNSPSSVMMYKRDPIHRATNTK
jgi:hypothetical protein